MSRAYKQLDDLDRARAVSADVVAAAEAIHDDVQVGIALSNLASVATALGQLPQALSHRERAEAIRRRQNDASALPYDLANRADLLIRLGRFDDASRALDELDAGIRSGIEAYVGRSRRASYLRGLAAVMVLRPQDAIRHLRSVPPSGSGDEASIMAPVLLTYAQARLAPRTGRGGSAAASAGATTDPETSRERQYWLAAAALERGSAAAALAEAARGLALLGELSNDELRWRLAALGAIAARVLRQADTARTMRATADEALARLRAAWPADVETYERRPDLAELAKRLGPA
jgi:hypothetical protein